MTIQRGAAGLNFRAVGFFFSVAIRRVVAVVYMIRLLAATFKGLALLGGVAVCMAFDPHLLSTPLCEKVESVLKKQQEKEKQMWSKAFS